MRMLLASCEEIGCVGRVTRLLYEETAPVKFRLYTIAARLIKELDNSAPLMSVDDTHSVIDSERR